MTEQEIYKALGVKQDFKPKNEIAKKLLAICLANGKNPKGLNLPYSLIGYAIVQEKEEITKLILNILTSEKYSKYNKETLTKLISAFESGEINPTQITLKILSTLRDDPVLISIKEKIVKKLLELDQDFTPSNETARDWWDRIINSKDPRVNQVLLNKNATQLLRHLLTAKSKETSDYIVAFINTDYLDHYKKNELASLARKPYANSYIIALDNIGPLNTATSIEICRLANENDGYPDYETLKKFIDSQESVKDDPRFTLKANRLNQELSGKKPRQRLKPFYSNNEKLNTFIVTFIYLKKEDVMGLEDLLPDNEVNQIYTDQWYNGREYFVIPVGLEYPQFGLTVNCKEPYDNPMLAFISESQTKRTADTRTRRVPTLLERFLQSKSKSEE